ncbi:hypothetical protein F5Y06DRAFT_307936 [Hypoxylon sp. FL0890]|nr:hypothetical protein F5Y06DRAFT_307936 [Hypoxylon sp. FL0890]
MDPEGQSVALPLLPANKDHGGDDDLSDEEMKSCSSCEYNDMEDSDQHDEETQELLQEVKLSMADFGRALNFACGGAVPVEQVQVSEQDLNIPSCNPMTLRWDSPDPSAPSSRCKLTLPIEPSISDKLSHLMTDMASDMYEKTECNPLKLDPSQFSIDFSPYECGIIDTVTQILRPTWASARIPMVVKAQLYELNICAGPSACITSHVETPRSTSQFGWLVVCLPIAHDGGQLEVRHEGNAITFDWSNMDIARPSIQWAAFSSDCKQEVSEMRAGYRLTLRYSLCPVRGNGQLTGHCKALDAKKLPLYKQMRALFDKKSFMPKGGYLGFYVVHPYPHTSSTFRFPGALKGLDMAIWECFKALGCKLTLHPVARAPGECGCAGWRYYIGNDFTLYVPYGSYDYYELDDLFTGWSTDEQPEFEDVTWLNEPGNEELQLAYRTTDDDEISESYSTCAIIIEVRNTQEFDSDTHMY